MAHSEEQVLVIPESHFRRVGYFEGFEHSQALKALLDPGQFRFLPRSQAETDPAFKQIIPYCVLCCDGLIFRYRRGTGGTEKRLHSLYSIGIGGHVNPCDGTADDDLYRTGMQRELHEEVEIGPILQDDLIGFIYDSSTPVGQVHLGVVHRILLAKSEARLRESKLEEGGFDSISSIRENAGAYETWSRLILDKRVEKISQGQDGFRAVRTP